MLLVDASRVPLLLLDIFDKFFEYQIWCGAVLNRPMCVVEKLLDLGVAGRFGLIVVHVFCYLI